MLTHQDFNSTYEPEKQVENRAKTFLGVAKAMALQWAGKVDK